MGLFRPAPPPSLLTATSQAVKVAPYSQLSGVYDVLMWHVDYVQWGRYLTDIAKRYPPPPGMWCEGGCGTGNIAIRIAKLGTPVCGFDLSPQMVFEAKRKAAEQQLAVSYSVGSFTDFSQRDLAYLFVVYDGINYLTDPADLKRFLQLARVALKPGGLLVFDLCTARNSIRHLSDYYDLQERNGIRFRRHSWFDRETRLHHNDFEITHDDQPGIVYIEQHLQRIYDVREASDLAQRCGFKPLAIFGDVTLSPGSEHNDRVHIVMRNG